MQKYLAVTSIIILFLTFLIMQLFVNGKLSGKTGTIILCTGVGISILSALLSERGRLKTILLSVYGVLLLGFITVSILVGISGL